MAEGEVVEPDASVVVAPVDPVVETPADPDEVDAIELPQGKMVPLAALKAARGESKSLKMALESAQGDVQFAAQNRPVLDFIKQHPEILRPQAQAPSASVPAAGDDPLLLELAQSLDYYKTDGSPDLVRAAKFGKILKREAETMARQMVEPVAGTLLHQQSQRNWEAAVQEKLPNGQPIDVKLLTSAWTDVLQYPNAAHILADPKAVRVILNTVKMQQLESGWTPQQPTAPGQAPVRTEPVGHAPRTKVVISEAERAIVGGRMTDQKYTELTKDFKPGRPNVLED